MYGLFVSKVSEKKRDHKKQSRFLMIFVFWPFALELVRSQHLRGIEGFVELLLRHQSLLEHDVVD